jgi:ribosomal protein L35
MSQKTNKSFTKRLKLPKMVSLKARKPGFNHFNAKQSRSKQLNGKVNFKVCQNYGTISPRFFIMKPKTA